MKKVYCISGLGADKRVFAALKLPEIELVHIAWLSPSIDDTMGSYAKKLLPQIDTSTSVTILGLSFGGMLAVEVGHWIENSQIIVLSSAVTASAIPLRYRLLGQWKIPDKIPFSILQKTNALTYYFFGIKTKQYQVLLNNILQDTEEHFFRWAVQAIVNWKNEKVPLDLIQIHGTNDKILPLVKTPSLILVKGGGHFMVLEQADQVAQILNDILS
ncbi:alpha/beta hydrolase [Aureispira sp. CCB-E]|uniref:alpha/beta hydrolase n=1 Tax=Aureispira sp. CCB-E TaxID=3051121 RepID=UPI002868FA3B|nr:alpha/beta hydrolase [Aureispira sp. CCB-E]WMX16877.1 alpha/beta hydrolase [Aureispira sp. CCB-E]